MSEHSKVFPRAAVDRRWRLNDAIHLYAWNIKSFYQTTVQQLTKSDKIVWPNYLLGTFDELMKAGYVPGGVDVVFGGDIPNGAGLSSSAALESGMLFALNTLFKFNLPLPKLAWLAQQAENNFVGMKCGIMDMFASLMGKKGHVFRDLKYEYFPVNFAEHSLLLCDSGVKHALVDSAYNTRRQECEAGVAILQKIWPEVQSLRDVTPEMLKKAQKKLPPVVYQRCMYVVEEIERVLKASDALQNGQVSELGHLLYQTHEGLRNAYQVSCDEIDFLVEEASKVPAIVGSRMMGGGFGGCTINVIRNDAIAAFQDEISAKYLATYNHNLQCYPVELTDGVRAV
jgi:galactokinase